MITHKKNHKYSECLTHPNYLYQGKENSQFSKWILVKFSSKSYIISVEKYKILQVEVGHVNFIGYVQPWAGLVTINILFHL